MNLNLRKALYIMTTAALIYGFVVCRADVDIWQGEIKP